MIMIQKYSLALTLFFANCCSLPIKAQNVPKDPAIPAKNSHSKSGSQPAVSGEQIFAQNCSRCHAAPQGFAPRISGTVVMHMRVRASLSLDEAQALLRFFNP
jgi:cytochrome c5